MLISSVVCALDKRIGELIFGCLYGVELMKDGLEIPLLDR